MKDYKLIETIAKELNCSSRTIRRNLNKIGKEKYSKIINGKLHVHASYFDAHKEPGETKYYILYNANEDIYHSESVETYEQTKPHLYQNGYKIILDYRTLTRSEYLDFVQKERAKKWQNKNIDIQIEKVVFDNNLTRYFIRSFKVDSQEVTDFATAGFYGQLFIDFANTLYNKSDQAKIDYKNYIARKSEQKKGYVYLMVDHNTGYHKIGFSKDPKHREKTLQSEKPTIELLHKFEGTMQKEKELHKEYDSKRIRGEWFDLDPWDIEHIKTL